MEQQVLVKNDINCLCAQFVINGETGEVNTMITPFKDSIRNVVVERIKTGSYLLTFFTKHNIQDNSKPFIMVQVASCNGIPMLANVLCNKETNKKEPLVEFLPKNTDYQYKFNIRIDVFSLSINTCSEKQDASVLYVDLLAKNQGYATVLAGLRKQYGLD